MRNFTHYVNYTYSGGQNDSDKPSELLPTEGVLVQNAYIRKAGKLQKRSGITLVGNDSGNTAIDGQYYWKTPTGTKYFLRMTGGALQYLDSATWTNMDTGFTAGNPVTFVPANGKLYIFNGVETTHSWDGAAVTLNSCLTDLGTSIPTGKYAIYWKNYMFVWGGVTLSTTVVEDTCYFSNLGDPDTFTTGTDYFYVGRKDGQIGTGITALESFLIFGKERSIHILTGSNPGEWKLSGTVNNLVLISEGIGVASHRSMVQVGDDIWFMGSDGLIRSLRRNENATTPLTGIVCSNIFTTLAGANSTYLSKVAAVQYNGRVYFAFPNGSSAYNDRVVVADTTITLDKPMNPHPWVIYTGWHPAVWAIYTPSATPQLYYGEASADSLSFQAESGTSDNTAAIDFDYKGPMVDLKAPDQRKTYRFAIVSGQSGGNYDVSVYSSDDSTQYELAGVLNLSSGDVWDTGVWGTATWGYGDEKKQKFVLQRASTQLQMRFRNNAASQPVSMYPYTLAIKRKKVE